MENSTEMENRGRGGGGTGGGWWGCAERERGEGMCVGGRHSEKGDASEGKDRQG